MNIKTSNEFTHDYSNNRMAPCRIIVNRSSGIKIDRTDVKKNSLQPGSDVTYGIGSNDKIWRGKVISREEAMLARDMTEEEAIVAESKFGEDLWIRVTHNYTKGGSYWQAIAPVGRVDTCSSVAVDLIPAIICLAEAAE